MIAKSTHVLPKEGEREYDEAVQEALTEKSRLLGRAMSYKDFTLDEVVERFGLQITERPDIFASVEPRPIRESLRDLLQDFLPLALAIDTERSRAEFVIAPVVAEVRFQMENQVSLFSGRRFTVDEEQGLTGFADFLLSRSPEQRRIRAPVVVVVEAKKDDFEGGIPQCLAEMVAAQLFNRRAGHERTIYGAVTTGDVWLFMSLIGVDVVVDMTQYYINEVDRIVGILVHMLSAEA